MLFARAPSKADPSAAQNGRGLRMTLVQVSEACKTTWEDFYFSSAQARWIRTQACSSNSIEVAIEMRI
jgi:hypothetical protein